MGYVEHLSPGAVIGVKLSGSLDEIEYEEFEQDDRKHDPDNISCFWEPMHWHPEAIPV